MENIMFDAAYDQLIMSSLMSFEKVRGRLQLIIETYAEAPSWKMTRSCNALSTLIDVVSLALRQYGTRRAKEDARRVKEERD